MSQERKPAVELQTKSQAISNSTHLLLLHELESFEDSIDREELSANEEFVVLDNIVAEDAPLLYNPDEGTRSGIGSFRIESLVTILYQYMRLIICVILVIYGITMLFNSEKRRDVRFTQLKKESNRPLPVYSAKDIKIVFSVALLLLFSPSKTSVLFSLYSKKPLATFKVTLLMFIVFIMNCSEDEYNYTGVKFLAREKEDAITRILVDLFYGISTQRSDRGMLKACYLAFDIVFYPNVVFLAFMVALFFLVVIILGIVTLLNKCGVTKYDLEVRTRAANTRVVGLTAYEIDKLKQGVYKDMPHNLKVVINSKDQIEAGNEDPEHNCSICYVPFEPVDRVVVLPKCEHLFHVDCIHSWFKTRSSCPICRLDMRELLKNTDTKFELLDFLNKDMFKLNLD